MSRIRDANPPNKGNIIAITVFIFALALLFSSLKVIDDGQVGVKKTLGKISNDEVTPGLKVILPIVQSIEIYNIKTQEIEETATVPSSEGLIVTLDVSVIYKLNQDEVAELRKTVNRDYQQTLIIPYIRNEVRDTVAGYEAKTIYSQTGRKEVAATVQENIDAKLAPRGIIIEDVLLRDISLPQKVTQAIELKLEKEQEAQRKEFELQAAEKDAEIEIARAKGVSEANKIISNSITENYIKYLWVQGLNDENSEVIYVPTEANLPILEAKRLE